ncbi:hypothetical protein KR059_010623 [Drosophila kikkawai]|nr:hypothetical protein KR059_010623 [Drosophila kikkawai]
MRERTALKQTHLYIQEEATSAALSGTIAVHNEIDKTENQKPNGPLAGYNSATVTVCRSEHTDAAHSCTPTSTSLTHTHSDACVWRAAEAESSAAVAGKKTRKKAKQSASHHDNGGRAAEPYPLAVVVVVRKKHMFASESEFGNRLLPSQAKKICIREKFSC